MMEAAPGTAVIGAEQTETKIGGIEVLSAKTTAAHGGEQGWRGIVRGVKVTQGGAADEWGVWAGASATCGSLRFGLA